MSGGTTSSTGACTRSKSATTTPTGRRQDPCVSDREFEQLLKMPGADGVSSNCSKWGFVAASDHAGRGAAAGGGAKVGVGSTTSGMKSYVPSGISVTSSREHAWVRPRKGTRTTSFMRNAYVSSGTVAPSDFQSAITRPGGRRTAKETSSTARRSDSKSAPVGARSQAFTYTADPLAPTPN